MPRSKEQFEQMREEAKEKIARGAAGYFARHGYAGAKISELAKELGIAQGALYRYFPSKEALFEEVTRAVSAANAGALGQIASLPLPAKEKIRRLSRGVLWGVLNDRELAEGFALNLRMEMEGGRHNGYSEEYAKAPSEFLEGLIREGQREESVHEGDPRVMADFYWTSVHMMALNRLMGGIVDFEEQVRLLDRILLKEE